MLRQLALRFRPMRSRFLANARSLPLRSTTTSASSCVRGKGTNDEDDEKDKIITTSRLPTSVLSSLFSAAVPLNVATGPETSIATAISSTASSVPQSLAAFAPAKAAPYVGPTAVKFFQVCPGIVCQILFLAPLEAMRKIKAENSTGALTAVAMMCNGIIWVAYGALRNDMSVLVPNITSLVMGTYYTRTFAQHTDQSMTPHYAAIVGVAAATAGLAATLPTTLAADYTGYLGMAIAAIMVGGPMATVQTVLKEKSTRSLRLPFAVATVANALAWMGYGGLVIHDPIIWAPNVVGLLSGTAQLFLFAKYGVAKEE